ARSQNRSRCSVVVSRRADLTAPQDGRTIETMFVQRVIRASVLVLAATIALSPLATCMTASEAGDAEMACCAKMHHECMAGGQAQKCCDSSRAHEQQLVVAKHESPVGALIALP